MNQNGKNQENKITLVTDGSLTIARVCGAKMELQEALQNSQHIELNMDAAAEVDLAFLQLLCSAHRTSESMDKTLALQGTIPAIFKKSIEDNGYARPHGCILDVNKTCLWMIK